MLRKYSLGSLIIIKNVILIKTFTTYREWQSDAVKMNRTQEAWVPNFGSYGFLINLSVLVSNLDREGIRLDAL